MVAAVSSNGPEARDELSTPSWPNACTRGGMNTDRAARIWTMARSIVAGGAATGADLAVLALAVGGLGLAPRDANLPALLVGAAVQFFGNRHYAFRAAGGSLKRQASWFALAEVVTLAMNAVLYDLVARAVVLGVSGALVLRAGISFGVFALWSYPVWRWIFRNAEAPELDADPSRRAA